MVHCILCRDHTFNFPKECISFFENRLANSVDPNVMPHYLTFHLGLRCLYQFLGFCFSKG